MYTKVPNCHILFKTVLFIYVKNTKTPMLRWLCQNSKSLDPHRSRTSGSKRQCLLCYNMYGIIRRGQRWTATFILRHPAIKVIHCLHSAALLAARRDSDIIFPRTVSIEFVINPLTQLDIILFLFRQ